MGEEGSGCPLVSSRGMLTCLHFPAPAGRIKPLLHVFSEGHSCSLLQFLQQK